MEYLERPPHPDLAALVRAYWWLRGVAEEGAGADPALPDGSPELIVNLAEPWEHRAPDGTRTAQPTAFLVGQITGPMVVRPTGTMDLVGVRFEAHAAAPFVESIGALTDRWLALPAVRSNALQELPAALAGAHGVEGQSRALDATLRAAFAAALPVDTKVGTAVRAIRAAHGAAEIDALARTLGVSPRTLQRRFAAAAGLSPKLLARIVRFQRVFAAWRDDPASLSRVALECGYFDQSHLVRDFRDFAGAPPAGFLAALPTFTAFFTAARAVPRGADAKA